MRLRYLLAGLALAGCQSKEKADLIVHHAVVYTVDSAFSTAQALAVKDGRVLKAGSESDIMDHYSADSVIDAGGQAVYPGFLDAHSHFAGYARSIFSADLFDSKSAEEMAARVKQFADAHPAENWISGRGWDQNKFPGKQFPDNSKLNELFPDKPVVLQRVDGHAVLANAKALSLAGIVPGQQIGGGKIETKDGKLTGILIDNATHLVTSKEPGASKESWIKWLGAAQQACFAQGLTCVSDCGIDRDLIEGYDQLQHAGMLKMRINALISDNKANLDYYLSRGPYATDRLFVRSVKVYADGALGSRGACLLRPYSDQPGWTGFLLSPWSHYDSLARMLAASKFQMCTHAIGDSANRVMLQVYGKYLKGKNDRRWRIEHAQIIDPADIKLFGEYAIVPSVQPTHATSDMYWAGQRLGSERLRSGYAFKQLLQQNGWLPLGTDFPVEDISPFKTYLAAVFRVDAHGFPPGGFQPENALSPEEAIRGMTIWAARAAFLEKDLGSLEPGKRADFIILNKDLVKTKAGEVLSCGVQATFMDGKKVWGR